MLNQRDTPCLIKVPPWFLRISAPNTISVRKKSTPGSECATNMQINYTGWSEDAIRSSPIGFLAKCEACPVGKARAEPDFECTQCPSEEHINPAQGTHMCTKCPTNQIPTASQDGCVCEPGYYNTSLRLFYCFSDSPFRDTSFEQYAQGGDVCQTCAHLTSSPGVPCADCIAGSVHIREGYAVSTSQMLGWNFFVQKYFLRTENPETLNKC